MIALVLLLLGSASGMPGKCGHSAKQPAEVPLRDLRRSSLPYISAYGRGGEWEPIRISVYYGNLNITAPMQARVYSAVNATVNWLQNTLKVRPIRDQWTLKYSECLETTFEGRILTDRFESDYVLYVFGDDEYTGYVGYAVYCQADLHTDQPVLGLVYINGAAHQDEPEEMLLSTILHEVTHALVFDSYLYEKYRKPDGSRYTKKELFVVDYLRGHEVRKLALPTLTQKARDAFACPTLDGLELETDGSSATAGVHWEKRVMYNDYMVADSSITDIAYTDVSVALFEDSGWYQVSYRYTNKVAWGYQRGCDFINEPCIVDGEPLSPEFCNEQDEKGCDFLHLRKGSCDLANYTRPSPPEYQYFSDSHISGSDYYLDYCPVVKPTVDCRDINSVHKEGDGLGASSRCFQLSIGSRYHSLCYPVDCSNENPLILLGDIQVECPKEGGFNFLFEGAWLECPRREELCTIVPCINNCFGAGYCQDGWCVCDDGTDDCNYQYPQ